MTHPLRELDARQPLRRRSDLVVRLAADDRVVVEWPGGRLGCSSAALDVLSAFQRPSSVQEVLQTLGARTAGAREWMDLSETILHLVQAGAVTPDGRDGRTTRPGFSGPPLQVEMLDDEVRTETFLRAIAEVVRAGDVVVDIGTGTGVLAVAAARAGARHVYAVEATRIGDAARQVFAANGLTDRITLIEGWSSEIELPERADVLITETIGNEPLQEGILQYVLDARRRLLVPHPRVVPGRVQVLGQLVSIPEREKGAWFFTAPAVERWRGRYGIDFSPLLDEEWNGVHAELARCGTRTDWSPLCEEAVLADVDLATLERDVVDTEVDVTADRAGPVDAVAVSFDLEVGPGRHIARSWDHVDPRNSWRFMAWVFPQPLLVQAGERLRVRYRYRVPGVSAPESVTVSRV